MVSVEEIVVDDEQQQPTKTTTTPSASEERLLDANEIESVLGTILRPTAKMQLEALVKKLRKEAQALKVVEATANATSAAPAPAPAAATPAPPTKPMTTDPPKPNQPSPPGPVSSSHQQFQTIDPFSFDAGGSSDQYVSIYLPLPGVGSIPKTNITCHFGKDGFDCTVMDLNGTNYRLKKDNLEHDIMPDKSKFVVKANKIILKLAKTKGEYGSYDFWSKLSDPRKKEKTLNKKSTKDNPMAGLNDLMRDMYENGDDKTRKMIGETLLKQRNGELGKDNDIGMGGGLGGMGGGLSDFDDDDDMGL